MFGEYSNVLQNLFESLTFTEFDFLNRMSFIKIRYLFRIEAPVVQDPRDGFGDYHSSSPERSQQP